MLPLFVIICFATISRCQGEINDTALTDAELDITQIILRHGYPLEVHEIETEDGYLLRTYRVPFGRTNNNGVPNNQPVIIFHGLLGSSENFLIGGPQKALAYMLPDNGYDVWLLNARGTRHSRRHKTLDPDKDEEFWKFTFHELGYYDVPATIEYITNMTGLKKMHYVGHSQGTTAFFVMASTRPEYNDRIKLMVALGPSAILRNVKHPLIRILAPLYPILTRFAKAWRLYEAFPRRIIANSDLRKVAMTLCGQDTNIPRLCLDLLNFVVGFDPEQIDPASVPFIASQAAAGCSILQTLHFAQIVTKGDFYQYDWGREENLKRYGTPEAPKYDLKKVVAPVSLIYGKSDIIITEKDVKILGTILPNVLEVYKVPYDKWTHTDFIWAKDLPLYLNNHIIEIMKKFNE